MDQRTGWGLLAGKIRTTSFIFAMTPILVIVGLLSVLAVILTAPLAVIGMVRSRRKRGRQHANK